MPVFGFFFSRDCLMAQPMSGAHAIELADTHRKTETFCHQMLDLAAGGRYVVLAVIQHKGEHLPTQLDRVAVAPLDTCLFAFALYTLEQPIHGRMMYRDGAALPCI